MDQQCSRHRKRPELPARSKQRKNQMLQCASRSCCRPETILNPFGTFFLTQSTKSVMNDAPSFPYQQMLEDCIFSNHNDHQIEIIPKEADVSASLNWISNSILNASSKQLVRSINIAANLEERINRMQKIIDLVRRANLNVKYCLK